MRRDSICLVIALIVFVTSVVVMMGNAHAGNANAQTIHAKEMVSEQVGLKECIDKWDELHAKAILKGHATPLQTTQHSKEIYQIASQNKICVAFWSEALPDEYGLFWPDAWSGECWGWTWREDRSAQDACKQTLDLDYHLYLQWATHYNKLKARSS